MKNTGIDALILFLSTQAEEVERRLIELRTTLTVLNRLSDAQTDAPAPAAAKAPVAKSTRRQRRARLLPGSLPARIVEIVGEAEGDLKLPQILQLAKARPGDVVGTLKSLVADGRVVAVGMTRSRAYRKA